MSDLKVNIEDAGGCRRMVAVAAPAERVKTVFDRFAGTFRKQASIPGFRQGKAPVERVISRYRKEILKETEDALLPELYQESIEQVDLKPLAIVGVQNVDVNPETGMNFTVAVDVAPDFKLPKYKKITVHRESVDVTDEDVDKVIDDILGRMARYEDVETGAIAQQDLIQVDYEAKQPNGEPLEALGEAAQELSKGEDFWLPVMAENEFVPGFNAAVEGKSIGDDVVFDVTFPSDHQVEVVREVKATYAVKIKGLRKLEKPELNEEILKRMNMESETALRDQIREDIGKDKQQRAEAKEREEVAKFLTENTKIEVPQSQVEEERTSLLRSILTRMAQQGASQEVMEQHRDEILGNVMKQAEDRVKLVHILHRISEEESIEITDADVSTAMEKLAETHHMPVEKVQAEIEKQEHGLDNFKLDVRHNKVYDFLIEQAKIKNA